MIVNGGAAGTVRLQWAQGAANNNAVKVEALSYLWARKLGN
jgi:hypothetical protein